MTDDLNETKEQLISAMKQAGVPTFLGTYPSESVPEILWNSELEPDPSNFVRLAKALGAKVLYLSWLVFTDNDINNAMATEPTEESTNQEDFSTKEYNEKVKEFAQYVGSVASVRAGFFLDGVFHVFEREAEWYEEFGGLIGSEEPGETSENGQDPKLSKEALAWAEKLASDPRFGTLDTADQQRYLLRKLAGDEYENLPVSAIVKNAATIYEVDIRPVEEEREKKEQLRQIQTLKSQGKSILAIAGKLGLPRDRVSMLLASLEN